MTIYNILELISNVVKLTQAILSLVFMLSCPATATFLPEASPVTKDTVIVVDLQQASSDEKLIATTLQGVVNRKEASLYLLLAFWDSFWLEQLEHTACIADKKILSLDEALKKYSDTIDVVIQYDPLVPATINIATMMAAVDEGIAVAPEANLDWFSGNVVNLQGRWDTNAAAYEWSYETLLPKMNQQVLACYHPTACNHHLRDYLVSHKVFHFWMSSVDTPGVTEATHRQEMAVFKKIMKATPPNIPVLGFWYSGVDSGLGEYTGVGLAGQYGKITVVSDWASNLSFLGGCNAALSTAVAQYTKRLQNVPSPPLETDKVYICFDVVESGDAPSYVQSRQYKVWQDKNRGAVPINWSLGPTILDLAPSIAKYYYDEATVNDYIYMAISGAGYCHPFRDLFVKTKCPVLCWNDYLEITDRYLDRMQCSVVGLYTDAWKTYNHNAAAPVLKRFAEELNTLNACVMGMGRDEGIDNNNSNYYIGKDDKVLVSHIMTRWPVDYAQKTREENIEWLIEDIKTHTPEIRPGFIHVMALSWAYTPSDMMTILEKLGKEYNAVTIPQFLNLYQKANSENNHN